MDSSSKPKVSVIVPIYNVEKYLRKCVDSILAQTLTDIEVILVDDGSPDGCPQIVDEYAAKDPRVVPVHQRNGGLSAARNGGLSVASGKYVGFVDADDWVEPRMYEELFSACEASTADIGACGIRCEFLSGGADVDQAYYDLKFSGKFKAVPAMLEKIDVSVCNKIFRREILSRAPELRFPDGLNFEDCEFFWRYFLRAETIFCLPKNLYHYVRHGSGIMRETMNGINPHSVDAVKVCRNILKDLLKRNCFSAYAFPFFLLLAGHYGMSSRSRHPDTDSETRKILRAAKYKKYRSSLPERENWAWEILDNVSEGKKTPLRYKIWHTKNCKGVSRSFFCGIRVRKKKIPEPDIAFACPEAEKNAGGDVPKVSVVVPVYNVEKYLRQSLDALVAQTLREIEIICVNDGSTDASLSILEEYSRKDVRIRIISRQNAGYGSAVNAGIGAARGEFLAIAEPDDYVDPAMFETLYFAQPLRHIFARLSDARTANLKALQNASLRAKPPEIAFAASEPAPFMRAEGDDGPVSRIVRFQKGKDRHGERTPPVRIADKYRAGIPELGNVRGKGRPGIGPQFLLCHVHYGVVVLRIGPDDTKLRQTAARLFMNQFSKPARIAGMRKIDNQHLVSSCFRCPGSPSGQKRHGHGTDGSQGKFPQEFPPRAKAAGPGT